jgi:type I restriction-modification system DNA methylase subunit
MTQQDLESYLWGAAVILRGLVDAGDYKQFVFPLVSSSVCLNVWDEDYAAALNELRGDSAYALATANDRVVIPERAHWNDVQKASGMSAVSCRRHSAQSRRRTKDGSTASSATHRGRTRSACLT